jgi:hypothetical protein
VARRVELCLPRRVHAGGQPRRDLDGNPPSDNVAPGNTLVAGASSSEFRRDPASVAVGVLSLPTALELLERERTMRV